MKLLINKNNLEQLKKIIVEISNLSSTETEKAEKIIYKNTVKGVGVVPKNEIFQVYKILKERGELQLTNKQEEIFLRLIKTKKVRTVSGVTPVTVMTKPYPCPGKCIYCPSEGNMPKSYIANEPGAQRALNLNFDPYTQTRQRLKALAINGHPTDKVELIIIGGTWSFYPKKYQNWFVNRCFTALNDFRKRDLSHENYASSSYESSSYALSSKEVGTITYEKLSKSQKINETSESRCVGLSIETRPDFINLEELIHLRKLGVTKVQIGVQSIRDRILKKNERGHDVNTTIKAFSLLRQMGFKIQIHWMPNLLGSSFSADLAEYKKLFGSLDFRPDEIKIYPCSLIKNTPLEIFYRKGLWKPYSTETLILLLSKCLSITPGYCRIDRLVRDISSQDIVAGNKKSNLRQIIEDGIKKETVIKEIRFNEVKDLEVSSSDTAIKSLIYKTKVSKEKFIGLYTPENKIAGFLRLSLPTVSAKIKELDKAAIIRELHIYGPSVSIDESSSLEAQHKGLGKRLLDCAYKLSAREGFITIAVISSVGTREYYRKNGFNDGALYQHRLLA